MSRSTVLKVLGVYRFAEIRNDIHSQENNMILNSAGGTIRTVGDGGSGKKMTVAPLI